MTAGQMHPLLRALVTLVHDRCVNASTHIGHLISPGKSRAILQPPKITTHNRHTLTRTHKHTHTYTHVNENEIFKSSVIWMQDKREPVCWIRELCSQKHSLFPIQFTYKDIKKKPKRGIIGLWHKRDWYTWFSLRTLEKFYPNWSLLYLRCPPLKPFI